MRGGSPALTSGRSAKLLRSSIRPGAEAVLAVDGIVLLVPVPSVLKRGCHRRQPGKAPRSRYSRRHSCGKVAAQLMAVNVRAPMKSPGAVGDGRAPRHSRRIHVERLASLGSPPCSLYLR